MCIRDSNYTLSLTEIPANLDNIKFLNGGILYDAATVSYTHLDVYKRQVLNALAEVSSTLIQRAKLRNITSSQSEAVEAYQTAVKLSFERYRTGLSNYIEVLYAQQNLYPAQIQLAQYLSLIHI